MRLIGTQGMPRRVSDYAPQFAHWNLFISIASFGLGASTIVFLYNMVTSLRRGAPAEANPWRALTLEWQVSSPPPIFNFDEIPQVVGNPYEYAPAAIRGSSLNARRLRALKYNTRQNMKKFDTIAESRKLGYELSTTTGCPSSSPSAGASVRAMMSVAPPGARPTIAIHALRSPNAGTGAFHQSGNSTRHCSRKATSRGHSGQSRGASASGTGDRSAGVCCISNP